MEQRIIQMACRRNATSASKHRNVEEHGSLVQRITTHKRPEPMDEQNPQRGTQSTMTGILLSDAV